eukprot:SAG11_NODE_16972_length_532_cov_1.154734_1_plen_71_part_10
MLCQVPGLRLVEVQGADVADLPREEVVELIKFSARCALSADRPMRLAMRLPMRRRAPSATAAARPVKPHAG